MSPYRPAVGAQTLHRMAFGQRTRPRLALCFTPKESLLRRKPPGGTTPAPPEGPGAVYDEAGTLPSCLARVAAFRTIGMLACMARPNAIQREARHLRNLAYQVAVELAAKPMDESLQARAKALDSAIRAWDAAADRERIAAGKPLPGSRRPEAKPAKLRKFFCLTTEPLCPEPAQDNGS